MPVVAEPAKCRAWPEERMSRGEPLPDQPFVLAALGTAAFNNPDTSMHLVGDRAHRPDVGSGSAWRVGTGIERDGSFERHQRIAGRIGRDLRHRPQNLNVLVIDVAGFVLRV